MTDSIMTPATSISRYCLIAATFVFAGLIMSDSARAQNVVAIVSGEPITTSDIEQRAKLIMISTRKAASREQVREELIDEKLKLREGKKYGLDLSNADVEGAYANMAQRLRMTPDQLTRQLQSSGIRPETLKSRLKADYVWSQLVRGRFQANLAVNERELRSIDDGKDGTSYEYQLRPIVFITGRGEDAASRRREAEALRGRVSSCAEAVAAVQGMRNVAVRDIVRKTSADLPQALRDILDKTPVGKLTPPEVTRSGIEVVALCDKQVTTADSPQKRQAREKLFAERFEAQSKKYLAEVRRSALIEYR